MRNSVKQKIKKEKKSQPLISIKPEFVKKFISEKIKKETLLFIFSFLAVIGFALLGFRQEIYGPKINKELIIKQITTKQDSIIAGQPVKWLKIVDMENLKGGEKYLELPKSAKDIAIKTGREAEDLVNQPKKELTMTNRREMVGLGPVSTEKQGLLTRTWSLLTANIQKAVEKIKPQKQKVINTQNSKVVDLTTVLKNKEVIPEGKYLAVEYYTEAPKLKEEKTASGKKVVVSGPDELGYTDVLAFVKLDNKISLSNRERIKLFWDKKEGEKTTREEVLFNTFDLDQDKNIDYIEWLVPHLSEQIFEIIFISQAFELDRNREIIEDIYGQVRYKDNVWATVEDSHYARVTFEQILDNTKDITLYAKPTQGGQTVRIEVYPENSDQLITAFENIDQEDTYKVFLTNLQASTDVFDLKIIEASVDIDYIVDPSPVIDTFTDSSKIQTSTYLTVAGGQVKLTETIPWACGTDTVKDGGGNTYNTVLIGSQCWMATNLDYNHNNCKDVAWVNNTDVGWCGYYTGGPFTDEGRLYQWSAATAAGLCPTGWHVPTDAEYMTLEEYLGMCTGTGSDPTGTGCSGAIGWRGTTEGDEMKKSGLCQGRTPCGTSSFNGLLAGYQSPLGFFYNRGTYGYFWSSTQHSSVVYAWFRMLSSSKPTVYRTYYNKAYGFSVRCLKD